MDMGIWGWDMGTWGGIWGHIWAWGVGVWGGTWGHVGIWGVRHRDMGYEDMGTCRDMECGGMGWAVGEGVAPAVPPR